MQELTLNEISEFLKWLITFGGSICTILYAFKKILDKSMQPIQKKMDELDINIHKKIDEIDIHQCKNFLVRFLADVERGQKMDDIEIKRAYDVYEHYTKDLKQNSYIHDKWERLMK